MFENVQTLTVIYRSMRQNQYSVSILHDDVGSLKYLPLGINDFYGNWAEKYDLRRHIVADLRQCILSGDLAEGELIRQELLAEEYDVSRMPIRAPLRQFSLDLSV